MEVVFTYCSFNNGKELSKFFYKLSLLSSCSAKKYIKDAHTVLNCDKDSFKFFSTIYGFDEINVIDFDKYRFDHRFWCFPKFVSYSMQHSPFIHVDLDIAFLKPTELPQADIYAERTRPFDATYEECKYLDNKYEIPKQIYCSGLYGGYSTPTFKEFFMRARDYCSIQNLKTKEVCYEHLYSLEEGYMTQKFINEKLGVYVIPEDHFVHFWERPKEQYTDFVDAMIAENYF